jgi:predicted nucleic acid-binding protein
MARVRCGSLASIRCHRSEIDTKFSNLGLGLVDATVATVAERRKLYRILTTDRAHFSAIRVGPYYRQALTLVP